jgi:hypothetical protein
MVDERSAESPEDGPSEPARGEQPTDDERVDEMELESFPASDPPSTWAGPSPA